MTDAGQSPGVGPLVCPFVALAEDRDRRADAPDERNRCYAEKAPRRRDLAYQAEYCYTARFSSCSAFLAWAARNAAEPAYVTEAAQRAWATGIASPEERGVGEVAGADPASTSDTGLEPGDGTARPPAIPAPTPEGGLFAPPDAAEPGAGRSGPEQLDWVSASAWADAPWDPTAEAEAEGSDALDSEPYEEEEAPEPVEDGATAAEALQGPKVPAALPMRRRRQPQQPIRTRGSGEWYYADPLDREPLVRRRTSVAPPILLAVLGLLVVSLIVFLLPTLLGGGGDDQTAAVASPSAGPSARPLATRAPLRTAEASALPSPTPEPQIRTYIVKPGDTLSAIAAKRAVNVPMRLLQCINGLVNPNVLQPGQELLIPPDGYSCPPGWRRGGSVTPSPEAAP